MIVLYQEDILLDCYIILSSCELLHWMFLIVLVKFSEIGLVFAKKWEDCSGIGSVYLNVCFINYLFYKMLIQTSLCVVR